MFVCTDILAFEGDGRRLHSAGDYDYYVEKKQRAAAAARESAGEWTAKPSATRSPDGAAKSARPRKLTFKETRELEGMEATILAAEQNIARIEALFAEPDFHRQHGQRTPELTAELAAAKERLVRLYDRWQELEAIRTGSAF